MTEKISENKQLISLVIPIYNEENNIPEFFDRLLSALHAFSDYEVICVCDGCRDQSVSLLSKRMQSMPQLQIIEFTRNFGKESALLAGMQHAKGDCIIPIDADLQHPPELIPEMVEKWKNGADMVVTASHANKTSQIRQLTSRLFYKFFNQLSNTTLIPNGLDYRLIDRSIVDILIALPEKSRFFKGLSVWASTNATVIHFNAEKRVSGYSKWQFNNLWHYALDAITSFSSAPLRIWSYIGLFVSSSAFVYMVIILIKKLFFSVHVSGYTSIMATILFLGGIQLLSLGVIGEYISRIYIESKNRPQYMIKKVYKN